VDDPLGEPHRPRSLLHPGKDTIAPVGRLSKFFRNPFASLFSGSSREDQLAAYVIREHKLGRTLHDILDDPYLRNRAGEAERRRLLERPDIIRAVGEDTARAARGQID
jgi:hypothetical protein